jgi:hypothetical protein
MTRRRSPLRIVFPTMIRKADDTIRRNIFDDLINKNPNFQRGIPYLSLSKTDKVVRYIRYYDVARSKDGRKTVIWGVPLLATILYSDDISVLRDLEPKITHSGTDNKSKQHVVELSDKKRLTIGNNELFSNRIRFSLVPSGVLNSEGNLFTERILPDELESLQKGLKDKIVVIGTSSRDKEGWYPTPVGDMAGIYIIGNAINMLLGNWQIRDTPVWVSLFLEVFIIVFASYMFAHLKPTMARVITTVTGFALLIPITYYFFTFYGAFVNSTLLFVNALTPVLGMGWHKIIRTIKNIILTRGRSLRHDQGPSGQIKQPG